MENREEVSRLTAEYLNMDPISWTDCFRIMNALAGRTCFSWPQQGSGGFNCHPDFTISDVWGGFAWIVTAPGDWILNQSIIAQFFELDTPVVGHFFSWWLGRVDVQDSYLV